jgi:hypothetical protein
MAIGVPDNFNYGGKKPNFDRDQFTTREAMLAFPADFLDEGHISYCKGDKKHYKWTGSEWVEFAAGGGGGSSVGVNLIKSPNFDGSEWENSNAIIRDDVVARANVVELPTSNSSIRQIVYGLVEGKRYTLSFVYNETSGVTGPGQGIVGVSGVLEDVEVSGGGYWNGSEGVIEITGDILTHNTMSFTAISDTVEVSFRGGWGKAQYWHVKLEEGGTATEWTDWTSDSLVSGLGIKTINGQSILGSGNIDIEGGGGGGGYQPPVGGIPRGDLSSDVQTSLGKADTALQEGALSEYAKKSDVPTKTSELTNDSGFVTGEELSTAISQSITNALNTEV